MAHRQSCRNTSCSWGSLASNSENRELMCAGSTRIASANAFTIASGGMLRRSATADEPASDRARART